MRHRAPTRDVAIIFPWKIQVCGSHSEIPILGYSVECDRLLRCGGPLPLPPATPAAASSPRNGARSSSRAPLAAPASPPPSAALPFSFSRARLDLGPVVPAHRHKGQEVAPQIERRDLQDKSRHIVLGGNMHCSHEPAAHMQTPLCCVTAARTGTGETLADLGAEEPHGQPDERPVLDDARDVDRERRCRPRSAGTPPAHWDQHTWFMSKASTRFGVRCGQHISCC